MAERRMFSKSIIDSDLFLDMPLSTQALYFHLAMRADDEGFVNNPNKIIRMINADDDSMKLLIAKSFIIPFESGIIVIRHWKIHNYIQKDRIKQTAYLSEKSQLTCSENGEYQLSENPGQIYLSGDTTIPQAEERLPCPFAEIKSLFNSICKSYSSIRDITGIRKTAVEARFKANPDLSIFKELFELAESSDFLKGKNNRNWRASFDWLMKASNFDKVLERRYNSQKASVDTEYEYPFYDNGVKHD